MSYDLSATISILLARIAASEAVSDALHARSLRIIGRHRSAVQRRDWDTCSALMAEHSALVEAMGAETDRRRPLFLALERTYRAQVQRAR